MLAFATLLDVGALTRSAWPPAPIPRGSSNGVRVDFSRDENLRVTMVHSTFATGCSVFEDRVLEVVLDLAMTYAAEEVALAVNGWPAGGLTQHVTLHRFDVVSIRWRWTGERQRHRWPATTFDRGDGKRGSTRVPPNHVVRRVGLVLTAPAAAAPTSSSSWSSTSPPSAGASRRRSVRPTRRSGPRCPPCRRAAPCAGRDTTPARSSPSSSDRAAAAAPPTAATVSDGLEVVGQHVAGAPVESHLDRADVGQRAPDSAEGRPSHHFRSAPVPGPNVRSHRSTSPATPSSAGSVRRPAPEQDVHRRPARPGDRPPAVVRRANDPARADSTVSTRGPTDTCRPTTGPRRTHRALEHGQLLAELRRRRLRPSASAPTTWSQASSNHARRRGSPAFSTSSISRRRSAAATRSLAPACAKGSGSRGNTHSVRRMARCLTSERSA